MNLNQTYDACAEVIAAAREYRRRIKTLAPSIQISVAKPELLEPIKEAARALDSALNEV